MYVTLSNEHVICIHDTREELAAALVAGPHELARALRTGVLVHRGDTTNWLYIHKVIKNVVTALPRYDTLTAQTIYTDPVENRNVLLEQLQVQGLGPAEAIPEGKCVHSIWNVDLDYAMCCECKHHLPCTARVFDEAVDVTQLSKSISPSNTETLKE